MGVQGGSPEEPFELRPEASGARRAKRKDKRFPSAEETGVRRRLEHPRSRSY